MKPKNPYKPADVGVVVGRFQTPYLHDGHLEFLDYVEKNTSKMIVFLGVSALKTSLNDPLDYETRKLMIEEEYPRAIVLPLRDIPVNDQAWSNQLDAAVSNILTPHETVMLYGSRDSFLPHYQGRFSSMELIPETEYPHNSTEIREETGKHVLTDNSFRKGVIWATRNRFPAVVTTVDIAILNGDGTKILLGRKPNETLFRFIGGFSDPRYNTFEADARREVWEEVNITVTDPVYVASMDIDDPRYKKERDKIRTILFKCHYESGFAKAGDDIEEIKWFELDKLQNDDIMPLHRNLLDALRLNLGIGVI